MSRPDKQSDDPGDARRRTPDTPREDGAPPPWRTGRDREEDAWHPAPEKRAARETARGGEDRDTGGTAGAGRENPRRTRDRDADAEREAGREVIEGDDSRAF